MTQFQAMYRGKVATVVGEVFVQVDELGADGKPGSAFVANVPA